ALPLLRYWRGLPAPRDQSEMLQGVIDRLGQDERSVSSRRRSCCEPTEACLTDALAAAGIRSEAIRSEAEARDWRRAPRRPARFRIEYLDEFKRNAVVRDRDGRESRWEYLYACWRNVDAVTR